VTAGEESVKATAESTPPAVGATVSWTTGTGNQVSGTLTKLDDGRITVKTDAGKTYSLNPAKAKNFSITEQGGTTNGTTESAAAATDTEISNGTESGNNIAPELKTAGTKGKRGPGKVEEEKEKGQGEEVANNKSDSYKEKMIEKSEKPVPLAMISMITVFITTPKRLRSHSAKRQNGLDR